MHSCKPFQDSFCKELLMFYLRFREKLCDRTKQVKNIIMYTKELNGAHPDKFLKLFSGAPLKCK